MAKQLPQRLVAAVKRGRPPAPEPPAASWQGRLPPPPTCSTLPGSCRPSTAWGRGGGGWGLTGSDEGASPRPEDMPPHVPCSPLHSCRPPSSWRSEGRCPHWPWGGAGRPVSPARTATLLVRGYPFLTSVLCPCCSASFKCVSAWGRGGAPSHAPLNLTKSHGCCSPFV